MESSLITIVNKLFILDRNSIASSIESIPQIEGLQICKKMLEWRNDLGKKEKDKLFNQSMIDPVTVEKNKSEIIKSHNNYLFRIDGEYYEGIAGLEMLLSKNLNVDSDENKFGSPTVMKELEDHPKFEFNNDIK